MMKYLLLASVVYFIYKFFIVPSRVDGATRKEVPKEENDRYTDYEEID